MNDDMRQRLDSLLVEGSELLKSCPKIKAKRTKAYASVRNHALHAERDKFDIRDVGEQIKGTRELIEEYL